jgi:hypothetical protein
VWSSIPIANASHHAIGPAQDHSFEAPKPFASKHRSAENLLKAALVEMPKWQYLSQPNIRKYECMPSHSYVGEATLLFCCSRYAVAGPRFANIYASLFCGLCVNIVFFIV